MENETAPPPGCRRGTELQNPSELPSRPPPTPTAHGPRTSRRARADPLAAVSNAPPQSATVYRGRRAVSVRSPDHSSSAPRRAFANGVPNVCVYVCAGPAVVHPDENTIVIFLSVIIARFCGSTDLPLFFFVFAYDILQVGNNNIVLLHAHGSSARSNLSNFQFYAVLL